MCYGSEEKKKRFQPDIMNVCRWKGERGKKLKVELLLLTNSLGVSSTTSHISKWGV